MSRIFKKSLFVLLAAVSLSNASISYDEFLSKVKASDLKRYDICALYKKSVDNKNFENEINNSFKDENFKKGIWETHFNKHKIKTRFGYVYVSDKKKALSLFKKAAENGSYLAALYGLEILNDTRSEELNQKYKSFFSKKLMQGNYCLGYLSYANLLTKNHRFSSSLDVLNNSKSKKCKTGDKGAWIQNKINSLMNLNKAYLSQ